MVATGIEFADPQRAPEVLSLRERIRSWWFHDYFRTDAAAPARRSQVVTRTPVLADDGADLAAGRFGRHSLAAVGSVTGRGRPR